MTNVVQRISIVKDDLNKALDRLDAILAHVDGAKELQPIIRVTISNNVIVALISTLEESIRNLFNEYLQSISEDISPYGQLRSGLREANLEAAIKLLTDSKKEGNWGQARAIVDALAMCLSDSKGYSLFKERISLNDGNFRSKQLTITAQRSGIGPVWQLIADSPEVEAYTAESNLEARKNKIIQAWNELFDERDTIVHRVSLANGWGSDRIRAAFELGKLVFERISTCLLNDAAALVADFQARQIANSGAP